MTGHQGRGDTGSPLIANGGNFFGTAGHWEWREDGDNVAGAHVSIDGWNDASGKCRFSATVLQND